MEYRIFVSSIFDYRHQEFTKINIIFNQDESVTLDSVSKKTKDKLGRSDFMLIAWSPVDDIATGVEIL